MTDDTRTYHYTVRLVQNGKYWTGSGWSRLRIDAERFVSGVAAVVAARACANVWRLETTIELSYED